MKKSNKEIVPDKKDELMQKRMNRKDAIKKSGYIAATTMMVLLSSMNAKARLGSR